MDNKLEYGCVFKKKKKSSFYTADIWWQWIDLLNPACFVYCKWARWDVFVPWLKSTLWILLEELRLWQQWTSPKFRNRFCHWILIFLSFPQWAVKMAARLVYGLGQLCDLLFACWKCKPQQLQTIQNGHLQQQCTANHNSQLGHKVIYWDQRIVLCCSNVFCCHFVLGQYTVITAYPATVCCNRSLTFALMWFYSFLKISKSDLPSSCI